MHSEDVWWNKLSWWYGNLDIFLQALHWQKNHAILFRFTGKSLKTYPSTIIGNRLRRLPLDLVLYDQFWRSVLDQGHSKISNQINQIRSNIFLIYDSFGWMKSLGWISTFLRTYWDLKILIKNCNKYFLFHSLLNTRISLFPRIFEKSKDKMIQKYCQEYL